MSYVIEGGVQGKARLGVLGQAMNEYSLQALHKAGLRAGHICLDAGCGGGTMTYDMAAIAGEAGHVMGIDYDNTIIELNKEEAVALQVSNVSFKQGDIYSLDALGTYDIIYARFLLSHLDDVRRALTNMVCALKPGGSLLVEDLQFSAHFCYPASSAFNTYLQWYARAVRKNGGNPELGIELHTHLQTAGLQDVQVQVAQPAGISGAAKQMSLLTLDKIKQSLLANGIATEAEFDLVRQEMAVFTADKNSVISMPRTFQVWGRKP